MSDEGQIKSIIERVQRLQEEKRTIEGDIKEVYAEARANGYDVKALRAVVKHLGKDQEEVAEFEAIFDLYLQSFLAAGMSSRAHVARDAGARTREAIETAGSTVRLSGNAALSSPVVPTPETGHVDRSASAQPDCAVGRPTIPFMPGDAGSGQGSQTDTTGRPSGAGTGSTVRAGAPVSKTADPGIQPSVQNEAEAGASPEEGSAACAGREGEVICSAHADQFVAPAGEGEGVHHASVESSPAADATKFKLPSAKPLRPNCLKPEQCGGYGSKHCGLCERAAKAKVEDDDADVPAFVRKTHDQHASGDRA